MDKRKVIAAYRRGLISIQECAQIIGVDSGQVVRLVDDTLLVPEVLLQRTKQMIINS
ncbi:hypothetical protein [Paenibacillus harenae]|uniref:DNA-binding protein n=1 Tax=Paenibacillus harenae TaxID=306543 RepID=A0ABT9TW00_PAEHA|nr:hypothetical protein [Paenibacillus harenae]MDQ0058188.1 hypothetical protein [Paenibacillus harenae]MDQ0111532.1 hypothetical protein [Paenibacillus harenae]